ncbi:stressosome-associated protein Prli42 [Lysinibacillus sp. LZ02]
MSNKKFQKIVVYTMIVIMLLSTIGLGLAAIM